MKSRSLVFTVAVATIVAAPSAGLAQTHQGDQHPSGAAASKPHPAPSGSDTLSGVVVRPPAKPDAIPPGKRAAFDAEAAKKHAWSRYRAAAPTSSARKHHGAPSDPENYPGLSKLGSH